MNKQFHIIFLLIIAGCTSFAQSVVLNQDSIICEDDTITIQASGYNHYIWVTSEAPSTIFSTDSLLIVSPVYSTTYTLFGGNDTAQVKIIVMPKPNLGNDLKLCLGSFNLSAKIEESVALGPNLIFNGDFEQGNVGFTTDYAYQPYASFSYIIDTNAKISNPGYSGFDHTTGSGNFMIADGSTLLANAWCQTVPVEQNESYEFSAWFNNIVKPTSNFPDPEIDVTINGSSLCFSLPLPENPDIWVNSTCAWDSYTSTSAEVCIRSLSVAYVGNDFGIDDISLRKRSAGNVSYLWQDGSTDSDLLINKSGLYWVHVDANGCLFSDSVEIFNNRPEIDLGPDTSLCGDFLIELNASYPDADYYWSDGSEDSVLSVSDYGVYSVVAAIGNCTSLDSIVISKGSECIEEINIANIFTPNADGSNDDFVVEIDEASEFSLVIYDRWGHLVFESHEANSRWDGLNTNGVQCPDGTYYYIVNYSNSTEEQLYKQGFVSLIR